MTATETPAGPIGAGTPAARGGSRPWRGAIALAAAVLLGQLAATLALRGTSFADAADRWFPAAVLVLVAATMIAAARRTRSAQPHRSAAWALLALAYASFAVPELAWAAFRVSFEAGAAAYLTAGLYLLFYPLFLIGVLRLPRATLGRTERGKLVLDIALIVASVAVVLWTHLLQPAIGPGATNPFLLVNTVATTLGDLAILWAVLTLVLRRGDDGGSPVYALLAASASVLIAADLGWSYRVLSLNHTPSVVITLGWTASYLLAALAAVREATAAREATPPTVPGEARPAPSRVSAVLPYACLVAAWAAVIVKHSGDVSSVTALATLGIIALVGARHILGYRESSALHRRLREARDRLEERVMERTADLERANVSLKRRLNEITLIGAVASIAAEAHDEDELVMRTTEAVRDSLFSDNCGLLLVDRESGFLRPALSFHRRSPLPDLPVVPFGKGITGGVAATGRLRRVADVTRDPNYIAGDPGMRSELAVPVRISGEVRGVFDVESAQRDAFTADDEQVLTTVASELATAIERLRAGAALRQNEERFRSIVQKSYEFTVIVDVAGRIRYATPSVLRTLGYASDTLLDTDAFALVHADELQAVHEAFGREARKEGTGIPIEFRARRADGSWMWVEALATSLLDNPAVAGIVVTMREITERRRAEQRIRRQVERLAALRAVDSAITGSLDLGFTLSLFLEQSVAQLHADAAAVLRLEPDGGRLTVLAAKGLRDAGLDAASLPLAQGRAGPGGGEPWLVSVPDLARSPAAVARSGLLRAEGFRSYHAAPLIAREHLRGVFEVFGREPFLPDREWLDFFQTLAGQAAIAIDNTALLEGLQRSSAELAEAYDTTLEGWSRALELRDRETQGHSARVVEMVVRLARRMGLGDTEIVHLRRGALLHDIGKMGIPDAILLKPGELDEDEWRVMRLHPQLAYDLLSPIAFLRHALDIPYCHHEHWDGDGYPRGLRGHQIPLSARVFAVVDAWDALRHSRPYRSAWPPEQVRAYLREQAGRRFDPAVVEVFLETADRGGAG